MGNERKNESWLPVSRSDMDKRGWKYCDFVFVSGDAYVDHPSFAAALLSRFLESEGYRVGIISQPDWKNPSSFTALGKPRLAFLVSAGNMDSMVAHYTASKRLRSNDAYSGRPVTFLQNNKERPLATPGTKNSFRPDRATLVYVEGIRRAYKNAAVVIGGIEASLRRFAHYDYWSDTVRRSILLDSKADILVYGMGEKPLLEIARRLDAGQAIGNIQNVRGTCVRLHSTGCDIKDITEQWKKTGNFAGAVILPSYDDVKNKDDASLKTFAEHFMLQKQNASADSAKLLIEKNDGNRWVIQNPPCPPLSTQELDKLYELPFTRKAHPIYAEEIPALKEVSFSLVTSRGCFGGCSFCAITFHQGRAVVGRSKESLVREAVSLTKHSHFKGYIHDAGGPTANFHRPACKKQIGGKTKGGFCTDRECLYPSPCPKLKADHSAYLETLRALREIPGIKKVFIRSGIRFDFIQYDKKYGREFLETLCRFHVSGQLKVAPEHVSQNVLEAMGKCPHECYEQFRKDFIAVNQQLRTGGSGLKQYLLPYFISSHPGAGIKEAKELAHYLKKTGFVPEQTQDFYPTPGTLATVMYHTGLDPRTMKPIYTAKGDKERKKQRELLKK